MIHFIENTFVDESQAHISINDLGFQRGYCVFDFLRTYKKKPFHLDEHLDRFFYSLNELDIQIPYTKKDLMNLIYQIIQYNGINDIAIKLMGSGGYSLDGFSRPNMGNVYIICYSVAHLVNKDPLRLCSTHFKRLFPSVKTTCYLPAIQALNQQKKDEYDDIVYLDENNHVLESSRSNIVFIKGNQLITAKTGVLKGITKEVVKHITADSYTWVERDIPYEELPLMEEAFITATLKPVYPIKQIDQVIFSSKAQTKGIADLFERYIKESEWPLLNISYSSEKIFH